MDKGCHFDTSLFLSNVTFVENEAEMAGGAMLVSDSNVVQIDCHPTSNLIPIDFSNNNGFYSTILNNYHPVTLNLQTQCQTWKNNIVILIIISFKNTNLNII